MNIARSTFVTLLLVWTALVSANSGWYSGGYYGQNYGQSSTGSSSGSSTGTSGGGGGINPNHWPHVNPRCNLYDFNPQNGETYDFIVVGAGAAGNIVASRLASATGKNYKVLILEAGGPSQRDLCGLDYVQSYFCNDTNGNLRVCEPFTRYDVPYYYNSITGGSPALAENMYNIPGTSVAKLMGGGMGHNGVVWLRPTKGNLDEWNVTGWEWENYLPYLKKSENVSNTPFAFDTTYRGLDGPIKIESAPYRFEPDYAIFNACLALGEYNNPDVNGATRDGCAILQQNIRRGVRSSSAIEYLRPLLLTNPNLKARIYSTVSRVVFSTINGHEVATGVEYYFNGQKYTANANKEVILSGAAINTPKILIQSGIGPRSQLNKFNIPVVYINENVGKHLRNHKTVSVVYNWPRPIEPNTAGFATSTLEYATTGTGFLAQSPVVGEIFSFKTLPNEAEPDITVIFSWGGSSISDPFTVGASVWVSSPQGANGTVTLNSTNPYDPPLVNQNVLVYQPDLDTLTRGVRRVRQLFNTTIAKAFFANLTEVAPGPDVQTNAQFNAYYLLPGSIFPAYHYIGTARMGNNGDPTAVVDNHLRVLGVKNLRVVDGSIATGPLFFGAQAGIVGIAEKGAAIIIADHA